MRSLLLSSLLTALLTTTNARGQASFTERFDDLGATDTSRLGPQALTSRGWTFRNQSSPSTATAFFAGILPSSNPIYFNPQAGAGYLAANKWATDQLGGTLSNWAILPAIPNQQSGDVVTIWARSLQGLGSLEVRYSPTGSTSTGSSPADVGSFTTLLVNIDPAPQSGWTTFTATLPGSGRLALRHRGTVELGGWDPYVAIDTLSVGAPPTPPCNLPPLPTPGQTVTWTAANSPYRVCQNITIPAGATVNVQPGVVIDFDPNMQLAVAGTLNIQATSASHATFNAPAPANNAAALTIQGGTLAAAFADFYQPVTIGASATLQLSDCRFLGTGNALAVGGALRSEDAPVPYPFIRLERCTFNNSDLTLSSSLVTLRGNTFTNSYVMLLRSLVDLTSTAAPNIVTGRPIQIDRQDSTQPLRIDGIHATNILADGGLSLSGGSYLLGPSNTLQNNLYPLALDGCLMPGSLLPATGNSINAINVHECSFAGYGLWPNLGLPYRITEPHATLPGGDLTIEPGVTVESLPGVAFGILNRFERRFEAQGLPEAPITFRAVSPTQTWQGLAFNSNGSSGPHLEHIHISGANIGVVSSDNILYADSCILTNNTTGASTGSGGILFRKSRFVDNNTGASGTLYLNSPTTPNSFEGNGIGVLASQNAITDARNVWWNDPSGPQHPTQNPGGAGDSISGEPWTDNVSVTPFLTTKPSHTDTPPVVRMTEPGLRWNFALPCPDYLLEPGTKHILRWEARDDSAIASQRIVLSPDGHYPDRFTITLADNLPPHIRSFEFTVPDVGYAASSSPQFIRIIATDSAGQEAWDQAPCIIPSGDLSGSLTLTSEQAFAGRTFHPGDTLPDITWSGSLSDGPIYEAFIVLDSDAATIGATTVSNSYAHFYTLTPFVSTDQARIAVRAHLNSNQIRWFFGTQTFSIRHDPRMGFTPPSVQLTSPAPGASFAGGTTIPVSWNPTAAEGIYSFDIQISYDAGRTWNVLVRDLSAAARSYNWTLPTTSIIPNVKLRVIVRDLRFQNSSSTVGFSISPGIALPPCGTADFNGDGDFGTDADIEAFFACLAGSCCSTCYQGGADFNADGDTGTDADIETFFRVLAGNPC